MVIIPSEFDYPDMTKAVACIWDVEPNNLINKRTEMKTSLLESLLITPQNHITLNIDAVVK